MTRLRILALAVLLTGSTIGTAAQLSFSPSAATILEGDTLAVDLEISGLGDFASPSLGAFKTDILFDDAILDFDSVVYGALLGDPDPLSFETDIVTTTGAGLVTLDEFSFLFDFELDALQPETFSLATLNFTGQAVGTSALTFGDVDLSDAVGNTLSPTLNTGSIQVDPRETPMPIPATLALVLPFALFLARRRR